jgi:hypothetical protein
VITKQTFIFSAPSRGGDDETDFARPSSTVVLQAKRVQPSSSTTSTRKSVLHSKSSGNCWKLQ